MPDYRISQAKLLRLAILASGAEPPKFDEVFGIIREAQPILDDRELAKRKLADAVGTKPFGLSTDNLKIVGGGPSGDFNPPPPVTGPDDAAMGVGVGDDTKLAKPE